MTFGEKTQIAYEFGPYRLIPEERLLLRDGQRITVAPKVFETLVLLVKNSGRLIEKDQLISTLWPDTFVEEATLARNISDLRKVLGESASDQNFIETVPKRGYRFTAFVKCDTRDRIVLVSERHLRTRMVIEEEVKLEADAVMSIAVLPFRPFTAEGRDEILELGIADALITRLSNINQIVVRPTSSVRKYNSLEHDCSPIGRALSVSHVLDGTIQRVADRIRVTAQLVSVEDGRSLWAGKFDERFTDIFNVEDIISEQVAQALVLKLTGEEKLLIARRGTDDAEAHRLYLTGRFHWNRRTREGYEKGIEHFNQAIQRDRDYALAYSGLADCYSMLGRFGTIRPGEIMPQASAAAATALRLDDSLAESHCSMGLLTHIYDWNWTKAEFHYNRAIELNASFATAHHWYAVFLAERGRGQEGLSEISRAQRLDPVSLIIGADKGMIHYLAREYHLAIEQCRSTLEMDPNYFRARMWLGCAYEQLGMHEQAIAEYQSAASLDESPYVLEWLARAHALSGNTEAAQKILLELVELPDRVYLDSYYLASVDAALREEQRAVKKLETAVQDRSCWLSRLCTDPIFDSVRSTLGFSELLTSVSARNPS